MLFAALARQSDRPPEILQRHYPPILLSVTLCTCELPLAPEASLPVAFSPPSPVGNGCPSRSGPRSRKLTSHPLAAAPPWLRRREVPLVPQRGWPRLGLAPARPRSLSPPSKLHPSCRRTTFPSPRMCDCCLSRYVFFVLALSSLRRGGSAGCVTLRLLCPRRCLNLRDCCLPAPYQAMPGSLQPSRPASSPVPPSPLQEGSLKSAARSLL